MGKYDRFKILRRKIASTNFQCQLCRRFVKEGEDYYSEEIRDKLLYSPHKKKFCKECVEKFKKQLPPIID